MTLYNFIFSLSYSLNMNRINRNGKGWNLVEEKADLDSPSQPSLPDVVLMVRRYHKVTQSLK